MKNDSEGLIKTEYDFKWKKWDKKPAYAQLALKNQKGSILDVGCATCQIYEFLKENSWDNEYYGSDLERYSNYKYPENVKLIIGDANKVDFPEVDTVLLYNILEHVDDPVNLLKKSLNACKKNVLIHVPLRNEEMWEMGVIEWHQLDKTHKHCGFTIDELYKIVDISGGKIKKFEKLDERNAIIGISLWNNPIPKIIFVLLSKIFSSKKFYDSFWMEIIKK
jgi:SAM-dependent methyltransferase